MWWPVLQGQYEGNIYLKLDWYAILQYTDVWKTFIYRGTLFLAIPFLDFTMVNYTLFYSTTNKRAQK